MRRNQFLTSAFFLGALLVTMSQLALGNDGDSELPIVKMRMDYRADTQIESNGVGEFVAKSLTVEFGDADIERLSVMLRVEVISREGEVSVFDSRAADCFPKHYYPGSTWIRDPEEMSEKLAPGFGEDRRQKITLGRSVVVNQRERSLSRKCEGATHAIQLTLVPNDRQFSGLTTGGRQVCLNVER